MLTFVIHMMYYAMIEHVFLLFFTKIKDTTQIKRPMPIEGISPFQSIIRSLLCYVNRFKRTSGNRASVLFPEKTLIGSLFHLRQSCKFYSRYLIMLFQLLGKPICSTISFPGLYLLKHKDNSRWKSL